MADFRHISCTLCTHSASCPIIDYQASLDCTRFEPAQRLVIIKDKKP